MIDRSCPPTVKRLPGDIYHILVNTTGKWTPYSVNTTIPADGNVNLSQLDNRAGFSKEEAIFVNKGFKALDHIITSMQEKDQITIVCVPKRLLLTTPSKTTSAH